MPDSPFKDPSTATGLHWPTLRGSLLLFKVVAQERHIATLHGLATAIRGDVTVLDGPLAGTVYTETLVFPRLLQSQLRPRIGSLVLGRLGQGFAKPDQKPPWTLAPATDDDRAIGMDWLTREVATPF